LLALLFSLSTYAQPVPKLNSMSPEWIQRGRTIELVLNGENLGGVTAFLFNGEPGLSATNVPAAASPAPTVTVESSRGGIARIEPPEREEKRLVLKVTAAADAALTPRELRVVAPGGVSNPLNLNVGQWPEVAKAASNTSIQEAQSVELPAAISGAIQASAQTNYYRFRSTKGQELVFEVDAARRGSALDSSLTVTDLEGREVARSEDAARIDSLLFFTATNDADYVLQLRDYRYRGGNEYFYRLYAGPIPYVESIFPFGAQRGKTVDVSLNGHNLDGTRKMTLNIDANAPRGRQEIRAKTPRGYSNPIAFAVSDVAEVVETEPNDALTNAQSVAVPLVINGRVGKPKDIDRFKLKTAADQKLVCQVAANPFGSKLDAMLMLSDVDGNVLQQNDDADGPDARIEFDAKKDTEYIVSIRDLTDRGGEAFGYRLSIGPPSDGAAPSFVARFLPDTPRVNREGTTTLRCEVTRNGGFEGPVRFALADLPNGVFAESILMPNSPASGIMVLSAAKDAPLGAFPIRLTASGVINGKTVTANAEPLVGGKTGGKTGDKTVDKTVKQAYLTVLEAVPFDLELATLSTSVEQNQSATVEVLVQRRDGFSGDIKIATEGFNGGRDPFSKGFSGGETTIKSGENVAKITLTPKLDSEVGTRTVVFRAEATVDGRRSSTYTQPMPVNVVAFPLVVSSTLSRLSVTVLPPGTTSAAGEAETKIKVDRRAGFSGDVDLTIDGLPSGIKAELGKIPAGSTETTLSLHATEKAAIGTNFSFVVVGAAVFNDRNYKSRTGQIALSVSAPESIEVATNAPPATATAPK
jgi:hypothetical protein